MTIEHRNEQYRRLMMSKNRTQYALSTMDDKGKWGFKVFCASEEAAKAKGEQWVAGRMCSDFKIEARNYL